MLPSIASDVYFLQWHLFSFAFAGIWNSRQVWLTNRGGTSGEQVVFGILRLLFIKRLSLYLAFCTLIASISSQIAPGLWMRLLVGVMRFIDRPSYCLHIALGLMCCEEWSLCKGGWASTDRSSRLPSYSWSWSSSGCSPLPGFPRIRFPFMFF